MSARYLFNKMCKMKPLLHFYRDLRHLDFVVADPCTLDNVCTTIIHMYVTNSGLERQ